jgi:hypothetical protein
MRNLDCQRTRAKPGGSVGSLGIERLSVASVRVISVSVACLERLERECQTPDNVEQNRWCTLAQATGGNIQILVTGGHGICDNLATQQCASQARRGTALLRI